MGREMNDIIVGDHTGGKPYPRWGMRQRALICQWQSGAWLLFSRMSCS
jgi:hypothetical protein